MIGILTGILDRAQLKMLHSLWDKRPYWENELYGSMQAFFMSLEDEGNQPSLANTDCQVKIGEV